MLPVRNPNLSLYVKIAAGFSFANIMLFSFPEYFPPKIGEESISMLFRCQSPAVPVLLYSSTDYFKMAVAGLRQKMINLDFPIALDSPLFFRSVGIF